MQPAQLLVQIGKSGRNARQSAVAIEGFSRHLHRAMQGVGEGLEAGRGRAGFRQGVELLLGDFDLFARVAINVGHGLRGYVAADADQIAAQSQIIDDPRIVRGVGRRRRAPNQIRQIGKPA